MAGLESVLLVLLLACVVVVILLQAGVIGGGDAEDTQTEEERAAEEAAAKAEEEAAALAAAKAEQAAKDEAARRRAQELINELTAGKPKALEDMTEKELTNELTKAMTETNGDESDPKVKKLMELIRKNIENTDDTIGMPSTTDIQSVQNAAAKTGLETVSVQTMSYIQRMYREIFKYSAGDLTSKLASALTKTFDTEADRLRSIRDHLTSGSKNLPSRMFIAIGFLSFIPTLICMGTLMQIPRT
eukprot:jgi/Mesvir1/23324/Mv21020-RA.1